MSIAELEKHLKKEPVTSKAPHPEVSSPRLGLYYCPLNFKKINDHKKPILFHDLFFSPEHNMYFS